MLNRFSKLESEYIVITFWSSTVHFNNQFLGVLMVCYEKARQMVRDYSPQLLHSHQCKLLSLCWGSRNLAPPSLPADNLHGLDGQTHQDRLSGHIGGRVGLPYLPYTHSWGSCHLAMFRSPTNRRKRYMEWRKPSSSVVILNTIRIFLLGQIENYRF